MVNVSRDPHALPICIYTCFHGGCHSCTERQMLSYTEMEDILGTCGVMVHSKINISTYCLAMEHLSASAKILQSNQNKRCSRQYVDMLILLCSVVSNKCPHASLYVLPMCIPTCNALIECYVLEYRNKRMHVLPKYSRIGMLCFHMYNNWECHCSS